MAEGIKKPFPEAAKGLNWGAFLLSWIWGIGNSTWISLLALIPYVNIVMMFVLLFKGNEWAWQNKEWKSIEHFHAVQRKWAIAGLIVCVLGLLFGVGLGALLISAGLSGQNGF